MKTITLVGAVPNSGYLKIWSVDRNKRRFLRPQFVGALGIKGTGTFG